MISRLIALTAPIALLTLSACSSGLQDPVADIGSDTALGALLDQDEALEAQVIEAMGDGPGMFASEDGRREYAQGVAVPIVEKHMAPRMAALNDEMLSRLSRVISERVLETIASGDDCMRPLEARDSSLVSGFGEERMKPILLDIAKMEPAPDARVATNQEIAAYHLMNAANIEQRGGMDEGRLVAILQGSPPRDQVEQCRMLAGVLSTFSALPAEEGGPLLRGLSQQQ